MKGELEQGGLHPIPDYHQLVQALTGWLLVLDHHYLFGRTSHKVLESANQQNKNLYNFLSNNQRL